MGKDPAVFLLGFLINFKNYKKFSQAVNMYLDQESCIKLKNYNKLNKTKEQESIQISVFERLYNILSIVF